MFLLEVIETEQLNIHSVIIGLGSVVDMYLLPWLNNLCCVSELEELILAY